MNNYVHPLQQQAVKQAIPAKPTNPKTANVFKDVLHQAARNDVKVSKHADSRLKERNIHIDKTTWQTIGSKMEAAKQKGVTDALVLTDDAALIVSTKNNTVVTALGQAEAQDKIFSNINGTILV